MPSKSTAVIALTAAGVAGTGFVALRLLIRAKVQEALVAEYDWPGLKAKLDRYAAGFGINLNLPPADKFAEALVPTWSVATPYTSIEDVLRNGRSSPYWPADYKKVPKGGERVEPYVFKMLEAAYYTPAGASNQDMAAAAAGALVTEFARNITKK